MPKIQIIDVVDKITSSLKTSELLANGKYPVYGAQGVSGYLNTYQTTKVSIAIIKDGAGVGRVQIVPAYSSVIGTMQLLVPKSGFDVNYLYFLFNSLKLGESYSGATIPHIYFKDYSKIFTNACDENRQKIISSRLSNINKLIEISHREIEFLDELIKSRFIEMFGDIKENTKGFELVDFDYFVDDMHIGPFGSDLKNDCFVSKEDSYAMVYEQKHAIQKTMNVETRYINKTKFDRLKHFIVGPGDILVSCRGTLGECYIIPEDAPIGVIHPSLMFIRLKRGVNPKFILHVLERLLSNREGVGSGVKMAIRASELAKCKTINPPNDLVESYLAFVDKIDKLKFNVKKRIELYQELLNKKMDEYFN